MPTAGFNDVSVNIDTNTKLCDSKKPARYFFANNKLELC